VHALTMNKTINWFKIPVIDLNRAATFYEQVLALTLNRGEMGTTSLAVFPYDREHATGGTLIYGPGFLPSPDGAVVYLNAGESLDAVLDRVKPAGDGQTDFSRLSNTCGRDGSQRPRALQNFFPYPSAPSIATSATSRFQVFLFRAKRALDTGLTDLSS